MRLFAAFMIAGLALAVSGCEDRKPPRERTIAKDTEIKDGVFGGTKVEKKELIEKENGQRELREHETKLDDKGNVTKEETKVKKPSDGTSVDVQGDEGGVHVDVKTPKD